MIYWIRIQRILHALTTGTIAIAASISASRTTHVLGMFIFLQLLAFFHALRSPAWENLHRIRR